MGYKVMFQRGDEVGLRTRGAAGRLELEADRLVITGDSEIAIPYRSLHSVEMFRLHGTGRVLRIVSREGTLFVMVIRFSLFGWFALIDFFGTGQLLGRIESILPAKPVT